MVNQLHNFKLQMQSQEMSVSDLYLAKVTTKKFFVSADLELQTKPETVPVSDFYLAKIMTKNIFVSANLDPDIYYVQEIARVFSKTSNHDPHTSSL